MNSSWSLLTRIESSSATTYADFSYGPNRERVRTTEHEGSAEQVIYHVGPHFEVETSTAYGWTADWCCGQQRQCAGPCG
ncbi:MAG: hypothetical protein Q8N51_19160 [Gammaproteobacteria bacterium]|nr:hypothetical protein [Gammaproteobacteria bacterium]